MSNFLLSSAEVSDTQLAQANSSWTFLQKRTPHSLDLLSAKYLLLIGKNNDSSLFSIDGWQCQMDDEFSLLLGLKQKVICSAEQTAFILKLKGKEQQKYLEQLMSKPIARRPQVAHMDPAQLSLADFKELLAANNNLNPEQVSVKITLKGA